MSDDTEHEASTSSDSLHAVAAIAGLITLVVGAWKVAGQGPAMMLLGGLMLIAVFFARRTSEIPATSQNEGKHT